MRSLGALAALVASLRQPTLCLIVDFTDLSLRYASAASNVIYGGNTYTAAVFQVRGLGENFTAEADAAELVISDLDSTWRARGFEDDLRGTNVTLRILYLSSGVWTDTTWYQTITLDAERLGPESVSIRLASSDAVQGTEAPRRTTQEAGCQENYRSGGCGYRGTLTTCDKGFDTPNGCKAHFPDVTIGGVSYVQPKPFGGFRGGMSQRLVLR